MLAFLKANIYNIIVIAVILLVVFLIIRKIVKDKKAGKSAVCGGPVQADPLPLPICFIK